MSQAAKDSTLTTEQAESGIERPVDFLRHPTDCMCSWCASERLTYCLTTRGSERHLNHHVPGCPAAPGAVCRRCGTTHATSCCHPAPTAFCRACEDERRVVNPPGGVAS